MLVIVVLLFGISWLPYQVLLMVFSFSWHVAKNCTLYLKKNTSCICRPTSRWLWSCPLSTSSCTSTCSSCFHTGGFTLLSLEKTYLKNSFSGWPWATAVSTPSSTLYTGADKKTMANRKFDKKRNVWSAFVYKNKVFGLGLTIFNTVNFTYNM